MIGLFATALAVASQPLSMELFHELQLALVKSVELHYAATLHVVVSRAGALDLRPV